MAKSLCEDGVISYDDSVDFTTVTEVEYKKKVNVYVNWEGKCTGTYHKFPEYHKLFEKALFLLI